VRPLKVTVLNVDVGAGHRRAAEGLGEGLVALRPGSTLRIVESLDYLGPEVGKVARDLYLGVQRTLPDLWGLLYEQRGLFDLLRPLGELADELRVGPLIEALERERPDLLVATHPVGCGLGAAARRKLGERTPLLAICTDFDGHPAWIVRGVDRYLCATEEVGSDLASHGLPSGDVQVTGIPLRAAFASGRGEGDARRRLGLDEGRFTILLLGGGLGLGPLLEAAEALASLSGPLQLVLIAGNNAELESAARALAARSPVPVIVRGRVEEIWELMRAADLAVTKPGGLSCAELAATGVPLVALAPLAGQEEQNTRALVRRGVAVEARTAAEAKRAVAALLAAPEKLQLMKDAALRLGRPASGRAAARAALELCDARRGPSFRW
jgi:processive 1,2-diacylglycerol beta-glucosyltransferase